MGITKQKKIDMLPSQTAYPAGFETCRHRPLTDPSLPVDLANVMQVYELNEYIS